MKTVFTILGLLFSSSVIGQSSQIRPYNDWETIAYCSYDSYHPSQYAKIDNNWEILYALRTPMSIKELKATGIPFTYSQIILLHTGGLIESKNNVLHTVMPIFDEEQTKSIRTLSKAIAQIVYNETKEDWAAFANELKKRNLQENAYSLVFSYVLDDKIWEKQLPSYDILQNNPTWNGAFWALYDKRPNSKCGTNSIGTFHQTWSDSLSYWPDYDAIAQFVNEYEHNGKIVTKELLDKSMEWGLADKNGNVTVPIIHENSNDTLVNISDDIVAKLASCLNQYSASFMKEYDVKSENLAKVILYHEVMWDMMDILVNMGIITEPDILKGSADTQKQDFGQIVYIRL